MKAINLTLLSLVICIATFAQTANISQSQKLGGSGDDIISRSCIAFNRLWIAGESNSMELLTPVKDMSTYAWLYGMSMNGDSILCKLIGGTEYDHATCIIEGGVNNLLVAGYTRSSDGDFSTSPDYGNYDGFLAVVDTLGNIMWRNKFGGSENDYILDIERTSNDGFILVGATSSHDGTLPASPGSGEDAWVLRLSPTLDSVWSLKYGGLNSQYFVDALCLENGNTILAGAYESTKSPDYDIVIICINSTGDTEWYYPFGGSDNDFPMKLVQTTDNNVMVLGKTISPDMPQHIGEWDAFVAKLNTEGDTIWTNVLGWADSDEIILDAFEIDNKYYGLLASTQNSEFTSYGNTDLVLVEFGADYMTYIDHFGGSGIEPHSEMSDTDIEYIGNGQILVSTSTSSNDHDLTDSLGNTDAWVFTIDILTIIKENQWIKEFKLFPNPAKDYINLEFNKYNKFPIEIIINDISGKTMINKNIQDPIESINISTLPKGQYLINSRNGEFKPKSFIKR